MVFLGCHLFILKGLLTLSHMFSSFLMTFQAKWLIIFWVTLYAFCTIENFPTTLKKIENTKVNTYFINQKWSLDFMIYFTLHLKQSGCQSFPKAVNLGADVSPISGAIGLQHPYHLGANFLEIKKFFYQNIE